MIAIATAQAVSHQGAIGGKQSTISQAVTTADRSLSAGLSGRPRRRSTRASAARAVTVAMSRLSTIPAPTKKM